MWENPVFSIYVLRSRSRSCLPLIGYSQLDKIPSPMFLVSQQRSICVSEGSNIIWLAWFELWVHIEDAKEEGHALGQSPEVHAKHKESVTESALIEQP